jgi:SNF2 family DNA or RNA helicase
MSPGAKAVVFSQWRRTHELIEKEFAARNGSRGYDHVFFHGGVPSSKRKDLVQRFKTAHARSQDSAASGRSAERSGPQVDSRSGK